MMLGRAGGGCEPSVGHSEDTPPAAWSNRKTDTVVDHIFSYAPSVNMIMIEIISIFFK